MRLVSAVYDLYEDESVNIHHPSLGASNYGTNLSKRKKAKKEQQNESDENEVAGAENQAN